jgi:hypothetical protein
VVHRACERRAAHQRHEPALVAARHEDAARPGNDLLQRGILGIGARLDPDGHDVLHAQLAKGALVNLHHLLVVAARRGDHRDGLAPAARELDETAEDRLVVGAVLAAADDDQVPRMTDLCFGAASRHRASPARCVPAEITRGHARMRCGARQGSPLPEGSDYPRV